MSLLTEFARSTKNTLDGVKKLTQLSQVRFSDKRFGEVFYRMITKEMERTEEWVTRLLEYDRVITPVERTGTVHVLLEETLREYQPRLDEKEIEVTKELEKNLPETVVPDEPLRYILRSLLEYVVNVMPPSASLRISTRSFASAANEEQIGFTGRGIEILARFRAITKQGERSQPGVEMMANKDRAILRFQTWSLEQVVIRNRGSLTIGVDQEHGEMSISLKFPVERRRVVDYQAEGR